jgi:uncharacterized protein involved in exopolysaccharide biosynthesis
MELTVSGADPQPSLSEFLQHARSQRKPALLVGGGLAIAALLAAALLEPSYRATATLAVLPSPEFTVRAAAGSHDLNASALALDQIMKAETEILESDELHGAAMQAVGPQALYPAIFAPAHHGLARRMLHAVAGFVLAPWRVTPADPAAAAWEQGGKQFRRDLKVLPAKDSNVIEVTFDAREGGRAAATLNTMLGLYAAMRMKLYDDPQLEIVRRQAAEAAHAVASADQAVADFKRVHGISSFDAERDMLLHRKAQTDQAAQEAAASAGQHAARLDALRAALAAEKPVVGLYTEQDADARLNTANADVEAVRAKLATASERYQDGSRMLTSLRAELAAHEAELSRLSRDRTLSVVRQGRNPAIDPLRLDQAREGAELAAARALLGAEQDASDKLSSALASLDVDETALLALERHRAAADENFRTASRILADRHLSEAEDARRMARVRVIQEAVAPQTPRPTALLVIAAGVLFGGFASAAWVVVAYARRPVFLTAEGLAAATGIPVLAVFSAEPEGVAPALS